MLNHEQISLAEQELAKTMELAADGIAIEMFSGAIDLVWHELLQTPQQYIEFSLRSCGSVVGHVEGYRIGVVNFIDSYERRWGRLPLIWFTKSDGSIDTAILDQYRRTGVIEASWNCQATHNCLVRKPDRQPANPQPNQPNQPNPQPTKPQ